MEHDDRRRSRRLRIAAVASLKTHGSLNANDQAFSTVHDLSRNGIGLETGQPPTVGQAVLLRLAIDEQIHELCTRATRVERKADSHFFDIGLDWSDCSDADKAFLDHVLELMESEPNVG